MTIPSWTRLREEALLNHKISSLCLSLESTALQALIQRFYQELESRGLIFKPVCFLADEWFCPLGIPAIGIPFYLASPRLRRLEQKIILDVEGGTKTEFMKLIRHEAGHAYSFAYHLYKKKKWRELFGSTAQEYTETYHPRPYSRSYVTHLENWYAQSHPDEDFAETFAVWLTPGLRWKKRYRGWKALQKLNYVDEIMNGLRGKPPVHYPPFKPAEYAGLNIKLKTYFQKKRKEYEEDYPDFYDHDLKMLFTNDLEHKTETKAAQYLKEVRPSILRSVASWTKEKKYAINQLMERLIVRTNDLNLFTRKDRLDLDFQISAYITSLITHYLFTGKFKRTK